jgi:hypothetical protein
LNPPPRERTAVLVIRVWHEDDALRARITSALDISRLDIVESAASSEEDIVEAVRRWLRDFAGP